ncbi:hypothetical protein [Actinophytocola sp.]|uniref:hypothetical protein n=1 Tax=Actinophytocola sp. TaxID=1872138 RepID=UPI002DDDB2AB|nr:hypothetical protein [Actinophytocola sp.]
MGQQVDYDVRPVERAAQRRLVERVGLDGARSRPASRSRSPAERVTPVMSVDPVITMSLMPG